VDRRDEVVASAERLLGGPCEVVADRSWTELGLAVVLEVQPTGGAGPPVIAKGHRDELYFLIELDAYRRHVPSIADRAPALLAVDEPSRVLLLSKLDAGPCPDDLPLEAYHDAGEVLRRFHASGGRPADPAWAAGRLQNLEDWIRRMPAGLVDDDDVAWVRTEAAALLDLPPQDEVTCHGDWQPRNWMVAPEDPHRVLVIDFERVRPDWWIHDVQRMAWREWLDRPDRRRAFLEGYGRPDGRLTEVEERGLRARSAAGHLIQIAWATEHGDLPFADDGRRNLRRMRDETAAE
jgi:Ser/Thr protein kinase RdoA (MazF antagonist)